MPKTLVTFGLHVFNDEPWLIGNAARFHGNGASDRRANAAGILDFGTHGQPRRHVTAGGHGDCDTGQLIRRNLPGPAATRQDLARSIAQYRTFGRACDDDGSDQPLGAIAVEQGAHEVERDRRVFIAARGGLPSLGVHDGRDPHGKTGGGERLRPAILFLGHGADAELDGACKVARRGDGGYGRFLGGQRPAARTAISAGAERGAGWHAGDDKG